MTCNNISVVTSRPSSVCPTELNFCYTFDMRSITWHTESPPWTAMTSWLHVMIIVYGVRAIDLGYIDRLVMFGGQIAMLYGHWTR